MGVFKELVEGGAYTLPFLLHIYNDDTHIYLINDNEDVTYSGHVFSATAFNYQPGTNGDAVLECSLIDKPELLNYVLGERAFKCDLVGVYKGGEVVPLETYRHKYGEATWNEGSLQISLNGDDRGEMTFPALIYNSYNNRGAV